VGVEHERRSRVEGAQRNQLFAVRACQLATSA
jgi:hypothetical protein